MIVDVITEIIGEVVPKICVGTIVASILRVVEIMVGRPVGER